MTRCMWFLVVAISIASSAGLAQGDQETASSSSKPATTLDNVPDGFPPLAKAYEGRWKEKARNGQWYSNTNSLKVIRENPIDEKGTFSADVLFTSYGGEQPCGTWTDVPGQLRWRRTEVIFFVITHPVSFCNTKWTMKFARQPSGKLIWTQQDGNAEIYFDPK